jgi:hypothetical protein
MSLFLRPNVFIRKITHGTESTSMFHIAIVVDPLSETAQKWSSLLKVRAAWADTPVLFLIILQWLSSFDSVYMEIYLIADQTREEVA